MIYLELLLGFLRVGLFSFGGAYASIPLIRDVVFSYGWLSDAEISAMIAVSESTPGPLMVNLATYIGASKGGVLGAIIATLAVVVPAFIIIVLILTLLKKAMQNKYVVAVLDGLKPCVIGIILATGLALIFQLVFGKISSIVFDYKALIIAGILVGLIVASKKIIKKQISPIVLIVISAVIGIIIY